MEAAAMTAGPVRNLTAMANVAMEFPQAIILGCSAMNKPGSAYKIVASEEDKSKRPRNTIKWIMKMGIPRLNMAIPRPASDKMDIDLAIIAGISIPHLQNYNIC